MPNALITGSSARASDVAAALRRDGFEPLCADRALDLVDVCAAIPPKSLDCYIQLPDDRSPGTTAVAEASAVVADEGVARYRAAATVGPMLAEGATVVLVLGERPSDRERSPGLIGAVNDLTRVLARALREDHDSAGVRVALLEDGPSSSEIASVAVGAGKPASSVASYVDVEPGLGFAEWRLEVLSLLGSPGGSGSREDVLNPTPPVDPRVSFGVALLQTLVAHPSWHWMSPEVWHANSRSVDRSPTPRLG